jgi:hypothetical protein
VLGIVRRRVRDLRRCHDQTMVRAPAIPTFPGSSVAVPRDWTGNGESQWSCSGSRRPALTFWCAGSATCLDGFRAGLPFLGGPHSRQEPCEGSEDFQSWARVRGLARRIQTYAGGHVRASSQPAFRLVPRRVNGDVARPAATATLRSPKNGTMGGGLRGRPRPA